jgi:iron complex outermembrane receptor protein
MFFQIGSHPTGCLLARAALCGPGALAILLALAVPAHAQQAGGIEGRITSAEQGMPLADVMVRIEGSTRGAVTNADGRYRLVGLAAGRYELIAQRVGLTTERRVVSVPSGSVARVDFVLRAAAALIAPVVVSATRETQRRTDASATIDVLDGAEIRATRAAHPAGIINRVPGVHVATLTGEGHSTAIRQPISTKPLYLYLEDGIPTRSTGFFNHNALYEINIPQSGGIEVLKGPPTALYGRMR